MPISGGGPPGLAFTYFEYDLDGGATQVLPPGHYWGSLFTAVYGGSAMIAAGGHLEEYSVADAAWHNSETSVGLLESFEIISDGTNVRFANGAAPGTHIIFIGARLN